MKKKYIPNGEDFVVEFDIKIPGTMLKYVNVERCNDAGIMLVLYFENLILFPSVLVKLSFRHPLGFYHM